MAHSDKRIQRNCLMIDVNRHATAGVTSIRNNNGLWHMILLLGRRSSHTASSRSHLLIPLALAAGIGILNPLSLMADNISLSGRALYEQYNPAGEILVPYLSQSIFSAIFETNAFRIDVLKMTGVHPGELANTTLGWDGTNYYGLAKGSPYSYTTVYNQTGWSGDSGQGRYVWLACAGAGQARASNSNPFPSQFFSSWVPYDKITTKYYPSSADAKVDKIEFIAPGQYLDQDSKQLKSYSPPYNKGYICAEYSIQYTNDLNLNVPISFAFSAFELNPGIPAQIGRYLVWNITFTVTNYHIASDQESVSPKVDGAVIVTDYRYDVHTQGALQYKATNSLCMPYDAPKLKEMASVRSMQPQHSETFNGRRRIVLVGIICSISLLPLIYLWKACFRRKSP